VAPGTDVVAGGRADADCFGRGTALAHLVAGRPVAGTPLAGMAPAAAVLPVRITDAQGQVTMDDLTKGVRAATATAAP
jgi:membrane-anchored mycosin MYCP